MEDDDSDTLDSQPSRLAPIGTKPPPGSKKADSSAKLNPNAKDFKSFFTSMKFGSKDKAAKDGELATPTNSSSGAVALTGPGLEEEESPPNSRKSRDTRSLTTTESSLLESGRTSADLARTPSYSNHSFDTSGQSAPSPSLAGSSKETFMQKITRKSSSGKFALPTFKREKSRLDTTSAPQPGLVAESEEGDGEELSASVSSLGGEKGRESKDLGKGSTRSWSSVLKLGKGKKGTEVDEGGEEESGAEEQS
jgi:hypothetical protein